MTVVRLYFDADSIERDVVSGLRARGIDAATALEAAMADSSDEEQLEFARIEGRVLFSFNVSDFQRIHTQYLSQGKRTPASSWPPSSDTRSASGYADCRN